MMYLHQGVSYTPPEFLEVVKELKSKAVNTAYYADCTCTKCYSDHDSLADCPEQ